MSLAPASLTIGGATIALDDVLADMTIRHGREDASGDPQPSSLSATLLGVDHAFTKAFRVGASLVFSARDGAAAPAPRFTGRITDAGLDDDVLSVVAIGNLSRLAEYKVGGTASWPAEAWSARVARIFSEAGISSWLVLAPDPSFDPQLAARDYTTAGATTVGDYLAFLAGMIGCMVVDRPDGKIYVQAIGARTLASSIRLDPAIIAYAPFWTMVLPQGNVVTVTYQADQGASVIVRDDASVSAYGERPFRIDTAFQNVADATTRANQVLGRRAYPHWAMPAAPVLAGLTLSLGIPLLIDTMPDASPYDPWQPILEGWTETIVGPDWTMNLALSDPVQSGLTLPWEAVPNVGYAWNQIDQTAIWTDALTLDSIAP